MAPPLLLKGLRDPAALHILPRQGTHKTKLTIDPHLGKGKLAGFLVFLPLFARPILRLFREHLIFIRWVREKCRRLIVTREGFFEDLFATGIFYDLSENGFLDAPIIILFEDMRAIVAVRPSRVPKNRKISSVPTISGCMKIAPGVVLMNLKSGLGI